MNKVFCVSCGFKILYEINKPKFCSSCGTNVNSLKASIKTEGEEEVVPLEVDINKLKTSVSVDYGSNKSTLQDLWGSVSSDEAKAEREKFSRAGHKGPDGQALLDQTLKDCAPSRQKDVDG
jgi:hypothetical protein|tara:strand:- start:120 stop:482 length:363 start_codon:yes stop_codon:yes gene_type:complete